MNSSKMSWVVSLVLHGIILLILFFLQLPSVLNQDFVEIFWGSSAAESTLNTSSVQPPSTGSESKAQAPDVSSQTSVVLPERRTPDLTDEVFSPSQIEKRTEMISQVTSAQSKAENYEEGPTKQSLVHGGDEKPKPTAEIGGRGVGRGNAPQGVEYSLEWTGGGTRSKISGELPTYPKGVSVSAQIRLQLTVLPDGSVATVIPIQKAEPRLETVAINEVKKWKFEPLDQRYPQIEQTCIVTFYFIAR